VSTDTSLGVVADRGEYFELISDAPGRVKTTATELAHYLQAYEYDRPALATCLLVERENLLDLERLSLAYCEGFVSIGDSRPRRARWVALDGYVVDVRKVETQGAWIQPPVDATYYGAAIRAERPLQLRSN
jgi:hypothetical protein